VRKWIVIAAIAVAAISVLAVVFWPPKKGSVEYHKTAYVKAHESGVFSKMILRGPRPLRDAYWIRKMERIDFHRQALISAGYLGQREYVISNREPVEVTRGLTFAMDNGEITLGKPAYPLIYFSKDPITGKDRITVIALATEMARVDDLIRKLDVTKSGK
jgi:hypothetical protein